MFVLEELGDRSSIVDGCTKWLNAVFTLVGINANNNC